MSDKSLEYPDVWGGLKKSQLVNSQGVRYRDFVKELTPRYGLVWFHIFMGHLALLASGSALYWASTRYDPVVSTLLGALAVGYSLNFLHLFMHEAAHYNLAEGRKASDRLANWLVGWLVGMDVHAYRNTHFHHHRHIGTTMDSEVSYFDALNMTFVARCCLGLHSIKTLDSRNLPHREKQDHKKSAAAYIVVGLTILFHGSVCLAAAFHKNWVFAIGWGLGAFSVYPFFGALRNLLEHRGEHASSEVDYHQVDQGETERLFGTSLLSSTYGSAGFNRHLLHHWEPQVSYTRLADLEEFLCDTEFGPRVIEPSRTTYPETFRRLWNK